MNWIALLSSAVWVDLLFLTVHKFIYPMTTSLSVWYATYGMTAVTSDVLVLVLGVALTSYLFPLSNLLVFSVLVQLVHDVLFYLLIIQPLPAGQNAMIDLFKRYSAEGSWKILLADSSMIALTVFGTQSLSTMDTDFVIFAGLFAVYALTYLVHTK